MSGRFRGILRQELILSHLPLATNILFVRIYPNALSEEEFGRQDLFFTIVLVYSRRWNWATGFYFVACILTHGRKKILGDRILISPHQSWGKVARQDAMCSFLFAWNSKILSPKLLIPACQYFSIICSTSPPGGDLVDGLPPVSSSAAGPS